MAFYLVRARPIPERLAALRQQLDAHAFRELRPFGRALTTALEQARRDPATGWALWEEEDYCTPPLAMERAAVLDQYFTDLTVQPVQRDEGWAAIAHLPSLWQHTPLTSDDGADEGGRTHR
ncbi:hypothetical protein [Thermorudis peleae]|uniref:hypothetical protein n=1 Tax=Thermorudis peleae TaxID=1382356 RepID=UPI00068E2E4F|nr:hypothetical protein [Thermorudis peleae]